MTNGGDNPVPESPSADDLRGNDYITITPVTRWGIVLVCYALVLCGTGYLAFFREYSDPSQRVANFGSAGHENTGAGKLLLDALSQDLAALKARREMAVQAFNVVLGAILGFLSASAAQVVRIPPPAAGWRIRVPSRARQ